MPQIIQLRPVASQIINVLLNQQQTTLNVYQKLTNVFVDVYSNNALIIAGVVALNANVIVRNTYLGYLGDFAFYDTFGTVTDPQYTGLGTQYILAYFLPAELTSARVQ